MATAIGNILAGGALEGVSKIIDSIRGKSPEDAAKLAQITADLQTMQGKYSSDFELAKIDENVQLNKIAGENIRAEQGNLYTAAARPSVIYCWIAVMVWNYIVCSWFHKAPVQLPDMFWEVSGIVVTGYVFARTGQEVLRRAIGGQGGAVQLPLGIKIDSKGD